MNVYLSFHHKPNLHQAWRKLQFVANVRIIGEDK